MQTRKALLAFMLTLLSAFVGCGKQSSAPIPATTPGGDVVQNKSIEAAADSPVAADDDGILGVGDAAPSLHVANWFRGGKIDGFEPGQVYVIEFWATWCGPCRSSMPHMAALREDYGDDVHFIGVTDEGPADVAKFMNERGPEKKTWDAIINYKLALDADGRTNANYMGAARLSGIPNAFVVGKTGLIEWIGHPMGMDDALAQIVDGTWDVSKVKAESALETKVLAAMQDEQPAIVEAKEKAKLAQGAEAAEHWDAALSKLEGLLSMIPDDPSSPKLLGARDEIRQVKQLLLEEAGRREELQQYQAELVDKNWENPQVLDNIAWRIADSQKDGDLELAAKAALQAAKLTSNQNPSPLDTLARVYYEQKDLQKAIEWQKKAIAACAEGPPQAQQHLEATLKKYESELE